MQAFYHVPEVLQLLCQRSKVMCFFELLFYAEHGHSAYHFAKTVLALMCIFNAFLSSFPNGVVLRISFVQQTPSNFMQYLYQLGSFIYDYCYDNLCRQFLGPKLVSRAIQTISLLQK